MLDKTVAMIELDIDQVGIYRWVLNSESYILNEQIYNMLHDMVILVGGIYKGHEYTITSKYCSVR